MSNLSLNNKIINSMNRGRYIDKLRGNIGIIKQNNRTPIHHKLIDTYEELTSKIPIRYIIIFISILIMLMTVMYYFKPNFILKNISINENQLKISSNKFKEKNEKVISYWKLIIYSFIFTIIIYSILYILRSKLSYIGKIFEYTE